ncbi:MAG: DUF3352 domain-containing protein [Candidatus Limnocylindria bacterium]
MIVELGTPEPLTPVPASGLGRRARVAVIGAVVLLAAAIGAVLGVMVVPARGAGLGPSAAYVPADTVIYLEARLDLPGAQRDNLRAILDRFPALDADLILSATLADTLDDLLAEGRLPLDYSGDVAPWFTGRVAMAVLDYPLNADPMTMQLPSTLVMLGSRSQADADDLAGQLRQELEAGGAAFTSSQHRGTTIWALDLEPAPFVPLADLGFAYAVTPDQLLLATRSQAIATALDVQAGDGGSLEGRQEVRDLAARLPDQWTAVLTVDSAAMLAELQAELERSQPMLAQALAASMASVPDLMVGTVAFDGDAVLLDGASDLPGGPLTPANGLRSLAEQVPGDAVLFSDGGELGAGLEAMVTSLKATLAVGPAAAEQLEQLDQVEAALGAELEEFVSWVGDGAIVAGWDGTQPYLGLVLGTDDPQAAARRLDQLRALARLAELDPGRTITVTTEDVGGTEVTSIRIGMGALTGEFGPVDEVVLEYAVRDNGALVGVGDGFVRPSLALDPDDSLAASARFRSAVERFGAADNAGTFFVDLVALREGVVSALPAEALLGYRADLEPNLEPFDFMAGVSRVEGDALVSRFGLVLR